MSTTALAASWSRGNRVEGAAVLSLAAFAGALQVSIAAAGILLATTLVLWMALLRSRRERFEAPRMFWPLCAYAGATLVSSLFSQDPVASLVDSKQLLLFLVVPAAYRLARGPRADAITTVVISVGAVTALIGVAQYGLLHYDNLGRRPQGTLTHYMTYSGIVMMVVGVAAARLLYRAEDRVWAALVMPVMLAALALTFTRSAWVGACAGIALLLVLKDRRLLALLPVAAALFLAVAPAQVTARMWSMFDLRDPTNRDRVAMLKAGTHMVRDHPLTGLGPNMVKIHYADYREPDAVEPLNVHLHNVPMQIAAERGLPALACWLWFVGALAWDMWRRVTAATAHRALAAAALAAIVSMLAAGLFEYNFGDSEFLMLFLLLCTLPYAAERPGEAA
jgi:O-antigen ligase